MNKFLLKTAFFSLIVTFSVNVSAQEQWGMKLQNNNQGKVQQLTPEQAKAIIEGKKKPTSVYKEKSNHISNSKKTPLSQSENLFENKNKKQSLFQSSDDNYAHKPKKDAYSEDVSKEDLKQPKFGSQPSNAIDAIKGDRKVSNNVRDFSKMRRFSSPKNSVTFTPN